MNLSDNLSKIDPSQGTKEIEPVLGCEIFPKVIDQLYESACKLGQLTVPEEAKVTYGNWNE